MRISLLLLDSNIDFTFWQGTIKKRWVIEKQLLYSWNITIFATENQIPVNVKVNNELTSL